MADSSDLRPLLREMVERGRALRSDELRDAVGAMLDGRVGDAEVAALLALLAGRGETADELIGVVTALRQRMVPLPLDEQERASLVDTCGTGGDGSGTFNISTAAALVAAAAGARVAKHGNRGLTSRCGSADVVEALGIPVSLPPPEAAECLRRCGFVFLYAPAAHPAMARVQPVRRALGFRNTFHLAGPLSNPAGARRQLMGVFAAAKIDLVAAAMARLDVAHGWVVHGEDGLDELTLTGATTVAEVRGGAIRRLEVRPEQVGLRPAGARALRGAETAAENAALIERILGGEGEGENRRDGEAQSERERRGRAGLASDEETVAARHDVVMLNAGACLTVAGVAADLREGVARAREAVRSGRARRLLDALRSFRVQAERAEP